MNLVNQFFNLSNEIRYSDFLLNSFSKDSEAKELSEETSRNQNLKKELSAVETELSKKNDDADSIKTAFIQVANDLISRITILEKRGLYPDLNHGMIVPGALLSHVIGYFEETLRYEGGWPTVYILAERAEWDFELLQNKLVNFRDELLPMYFTCQMDAITYYEKMKTEVLQIADELHKKGVI